MGALAIVGVIVMFVLMFICMGKEKKLSGFYKEIGVCGRWYAFFTGDFLFAGVASVVLTVVGIVQAIMQKAPFAAVLTYLPVAAICLLIGIFMYKRAYNKCPDDMKKRFFWDIIVIMLGVSIRVSFFFVMFIIPGWLASPPSETYTTDDGRTVYAHPGSDILYDENGIQIGRKTGNGTAVFDK